MEIISDYLRNSVAAAVFVLLAVKAILLFLANWRFNQKFKHFPQYPSHWFFGTLKLYPGLNDEGLAYERKVTAEFRRFHVFWMGPKPVVDVTHPDLVKIILKSSEPKAHSVYRFLHPWLGQGLLTSNGKRWSRSRRLLTPAFHYDILKGYIEMKNDLCNDLLCKFEESSKSGESLNVFDCISMFTLDVILQSTMSYETGCQRDGKHPYVIAVNQIMRQIAKRYFNPLLHIDFIYFITPAGLQFLWDCRFVHRIADDIITKRRKELETNGVSNDDDENENPEKKRKRQDFLDTLITARDEDGKGLTNREIRDEVDTFLFEGHDTTSSAISWCLYSVAEHQDVQRRVQAELDDLFEGRDGDYLLWDDMIKLPYLTMVLKESMRLHSPVPSTMRELTTDVVMDQYTIPKGTDIQISQYKIHHNPTTWIDSMKFNPERFSPANSEKRDPFAFVPFSAGPRNCIGQNFAMDEMRVALARILYRYEISLDPAHEVIKYKSLVMKAENDIKLYVKTRLP